ncbi:hypothetical protein VNI00_000810 [Paramarasmius palmivorus]|uniref:Uncharacterized protein n=1 Tax=Paramarasmius palmivorus TaxID=297713 RepID=A0AAW0E794_9AGAR
MEDTIIYVLASLVVYYLVERCIKVVLIRNSRPFFEYLYSSHKLSVFTGITMGALITATTTPACFRAAFTQSPPGSDFDATVCLAGRGVLWASELNRLDLYELYVVHHLGGLLALFCTVLLRWPYRPLLVLFASLVSEIPGDLVWMISAYRDYRDTMGEKDVGSGYVPIWKKMHRGLVGFNLVQYIVLRFSAMGYSFHIFCFGEAGMSMSGTEFRAALTMMAAHTAFCVAYVFRQCNSLRKNAITETSPTTPFISLQVQHQPYHITINAFGSRWFLTIYGLFMGLALSSLALCVSALCPDFESESLIQVIFCSVLGARIFSLVFEDGLKQLVHAPFPTLFRPGFWLHGGIAGAAVSSFYLYHTGALTSLDGFGGALAVGLPLYEFFSRIGCHCYGCCYGRPSTPVELKRKGGSFFAIRPVVYSHPSLSALARARPDWVGKPLVPIQLFSAGLFLSLFVFIAVPLIALAHVPLALVGGIVLVSHSLIRLWTEKYRADYRGREGATVLSVTGIMAIMQLLVSVLSVAWMIGRMDLEGLATLYLDKLHWKSISVSFGFGVLIYGGHRGEIGRWA